MKSYAGCEAAVRVKPKARLRALGYIHPFISESRSGDKELCEKIVSLDANGVGLLIY
jgi:hypothetical protein